MAREPRSSTDFPRSERWDKDRFYYERDERERDRFGDVREHIQEDDHVYARPAPPPPRPRPERRVDQRPPYDDGPPPPRDRRSYYDDDPRYPRRPPSDVEVDRRVVIDREQRPYVRSPSPPPVRSGPGYPLSPSPPSRARPGFARSPSPPPRSRPGLARSPSPPPRSRPSYARSPSPPRSRPIYARSPSPPRGRPALTRSPSPPRRTRPPMLARRQSSLDTYDRRPRGYAQREEYGPPARREDYRAPPYVPIPLPHTKGLPPPRYPAREHIEEIRVSDPDYYGDEDFRAYPERIREREYTRTRQRNRSRESRTTRSSHTRSSSKASSGSSSDGATTVKSEYPKKGKTRIPGRLVSLKALVDLGYPFIEEGNTVVVLKALGQENIDDVLRLSEDYKRSELEVASGHAHSDHVIEDRRTEVYVAAPEPPRSVASRAPVVVPTASPPASSHHFDVVESTSLVRAASPTRTTRSHSTSASSRAPLVVDARPREVSSEMAVGPLALVESPHGHHHSHYSHHGHHHGHGSSRHSRSSFHSDLERREVISDRELVRAERLPSGEMVLYEEEVERVEPPSRGVRIEKDKKGPPPQLVRAMLRTIT